MKRLAFFLLFIPALLVGQELPADPDDVVIEPAPIHLYKIISVENDTTFVDTSLSIHQDYRFNYLREDSFELLPFQNVGQPYNRLAYEFNDDESILPEFGARAKQFNFMEVDDIYYYYVPTPFTELFFKTVFEQGQLLDAFFTINTSEKLNFSIAYKGLRSLGRYQHSLASSGNFRATVNYNGFGDRYHLKAHYVEQDIFNEENGGLTPLSLEQYVSEDPEFQDRSRLDVNFEDAESTLQGRRFYFEHAFDLVTPGEQDRDGVFSIGHKFHLGEKEYLFEQATANPLFGPSFESIGIRDQTDLGYMYNEGFIQYRSDSFGKIRARSGYYHFNYGYNSVLDLESGFIINRLTGDNVSIGGAYENQFGRLFFSSEGKLNLYGEFNGFDIRSQLSFLIGANNILNISASANSSAPAYNFLLYQSDYINYNWQTDFENEKAQSLSLRFLSPALLNVEADYSRVESYAYFARNLEGFVKPHQYDGELNYAKVKVQREFGFGRFALNNALLYQKVLNGNDVLKVPEFITRNTVYYRDHWFQRALYLQTGFTFNYFTSYEMNAYDPVLAEFYVQDQAEIEGFPTVDFFFNGKIRTARIFFKLERIDALLLGNNNFAAPLYPARDFGLRFGLIWNFFM